MAGPGDPRRIAIDRQRCIGTGNCVFYAGGTFEIDAENRSIMIDPDGDDADAQRMAVENCPTSALSFADE